MPGITFDQPLLGAGASAQTDFAAAQARTGLNFQDSVRFKRGIKAHLGLEAFADASAELSKFVHASIEGTAFARAQAGIQLQLPLNLFDQFGFAARAEAIAEAAAGVQANLGLSIGDFVLLAQRDNDLVGVPLELLLLFLEEVSIGGAFEVNVSASAKGHASVTVTGCVIEQPGRKAGFFFTVDAGAGLAAGVGMGFKAGAEFEDFRRFYGRATDRVVDSTLVQIASLLPPSAAPALPIVQAFGPVAKIALRVAYEIGQKIRDNNPIGTKQNQGTLCNEAVKTILEECQRFILQKMLDAALGAIRGVLERQVAALGQAAWDRALPQREDLASRLASMPAEPFNAIPENVAYWAGLVRSSTALLATLFGNNPPADLMRAVDTLYCAAELLSEAVRSKVNKASAYALAIGAGTVAADPEPFKGSPSVPPPDPIGPSLRTALGEAPGHVLTYADFLRFLVDDAIVNTLLAQFPDAREFMRVFTAAFGKTENEILKIFLQNASAFSSAGDSRVDPKQTLEKIVSSLDRYLTDRFVADAMPILLDHVEDPTLRLYMQEVLLEAVVYVKDVALHSILNWDGKSFDNDDFTESLAGVMTLLIGRTVVIVADTFLTATQERMGPVCDDVAGKIRAGHNDVRALNLNADPDLVRLVADSVAIAGRVLGPLERDTRARVRHLLYQVFETIPPGQEQTFLENLGDQFFIPNSDQLTDLTYELAAIAKDRFGLFVEQFILAVGNYILEQLEDLLLQAIELVLHWETHLAEALDEVASLLTNLDAEIARLNAQAIALFTSAEDAIRSFLDLLSGSTLRSKIKKVLKELFVDKALGTLKKQTVYKNLPHDLRRTVRSLVKSGIDDCVDNPIVDPVLDAVAGIADDIEGLLLDCRELDPDDNLPEQVLLLVLDRIEDHIRDHFGGTGPHVNVGVDLGFTDLFGHHQNIHISLGRVTVNLNPLLDTVRDTIAALDFYHDKLNAACTALAGALGKELELAAAQLRKQDGQEDQTRYGRIAADHDAAPREIAILNPTSQSHHDRAVDIKIHLGGVPLSFLGLEKDESQRVLIYLNGELVPVKSLLVEGGTRIARPQDHLADFDIRTAKGFDSKTAMFRNNVASLAIDTARQVPSQAAVTQKTQSGSSFAFSASDFREVGAARAVVSSRPPLGLTAPRVNVRVKTDAKGRSITEHDVGISAPGRGNPASRMNALLQDRMAGLLLRFTVPLEDLVDGVNVLTVVVIAKGGHRHQQNVGFTASRAGVRTPTNPLALGRRITLRPPRPGDVRKGPKTLTPITVRPGASGAAAAVLKNPLPVDSKALAAKKQKNLGYLKTQDMLNFVKRAPNVPN